MVNHMSNLTDRVSYLKGLAEGLNLAESNEGKLIDKILELLNEMAAELEDLRDDHEDLNEYVESIDSDLSEMEDLIYGEEDECGCGHCHGDDEDECGCGHHCHCHDDEDDDDEDEGLVEYTCPHCGEEMTFEVENFDFDEDYLCPACHQPLFPETPEEE